MTTKRYPLTAFWGLGFLVLSFVLFASDLRAELQQDSEEIAKLLAEAKSEAFQLKQDAADLDGYTRSKLSWESHANKIHLVKDHINTSGKLLAKLQDAKAGGSEWQKTAIERIEPLLQELAANTETTIDRLNANRSSVHMPEFRDLAKANHELATELEALIRDFVNYGETKGKFERLKGRLEVTN